MEFQLQPGVDLLIQQQLQGFERQLEAFGQQLEAKAMNTHITSRNCRYLLDSLRPLHKEFPDILGH
jgi:hypothetical protein